MAELQACVRGVPSLRKAFALRGIAAAWVFLEVLC
jgi:hypothetical protein